MRVKKRIRTCFGLYKILAELTKSEVQLNSYLICIEVLSDLQVCVSFVVKLLGYNDLHKY